MEYHSVGDKVEVLRAKKVLKNKRQYENLYIRSAKSHEERVMELNFKKLMDHLEVSDYFRFSGSGRLSCTQGRWRGWQ